MEESALNKDLKVFLESIIVSSKKMTSMDGVTEQRHLVCSLEPWYTFKIRLSEVRILNPIR